MEINVVDPDGVGGDFLRTFDRQVQALTLAPRVDLSPADNPDAQASVVFVEQRIVGLDPLFATWVSRERPIFAVLPDARAAVHLPTPLAGQNAFTRDRYRGNWPLALCDELLARVWMRRQERKVFISYRRSESTAIARQLHRELANLGYEVFLDEIELRRATVISDELRWALNDVDAVVLLATAGIAGSPWVVDEIAFANARGIAVLGVCWSSSAPAVTKHLSIDQRIELSDPAPASETEELTQAGLDLILATVFEHRALAIKTRLDSLLPYARAELGRTKGVIASQRELGDLVGLDPPDKNYFVRVLPHRPAFEELGDAVEAADIAFPQDLEELICCYPECEPEHRTSRALDRFFVSKKAPRRDLWRSL